MPYDIDGNKIATRQVFIAMTERDLIDYTEILKREFPDIVFFKSLQFGSEQVEHLAYGMYSVFNPDGGPVPYQDRKPDGSFGRWIDEPEKYFRVLAAEPRRHGPSKFAMPPDAPDSKTAAKRYVYSFPSTYSDVYGYHRVGDDETRRFLNRVIRLTKKFTSNWTERIEVESGEVLGRFTGGDTWCGPDVIRQCQERDDFFVVVYRTRKGGKLYGERALPRDAG